MARAKKENIVIQDKGLNNEGKKLLELAEEHISIKYPTTEQHRAISAVIKQIRVFINSGFDYDYVNKKANKERVNIFEITEILKEFLDIPKQEVEETKDGSEQNQQEK